MSVNKSGDSNPKKPRKQRIPVGKSVGSAKQAEQLWSIGTSSPSSMGIHKTGAESSSQVPSFFYSPELTTESWVLPKSRQEILKWARIFFNLEAYVASILKMHAMYPFSKFDIVTPDPSVTEYYKEMAFNDKFNLYEFLLRASLSYEKFGEAIFFGNQSSFKGKDGKTYYKWDKFILLEPELVEIKQDVWGGDIQFELIPTEDMKKSADKIIQNIDSQSEKLKAQIPPAILEAIKQGKNIPLDPEHVSYLADITDPSATRGTPKIQCLFKVLIYQDWIRLAQTAIAQRYHFPVEIWKIGDMSHDPPIIPTEAQLQQWKQLINQSIQNPPFSIVAPPIINYEAVSTMGKLLPIAPEYDYILDQIMVGLGVNKNIITGEGPCLDEQSRVVTKNGPKFHWELTYDDEILTLNPDNDNYEYHKPTKIFKQLYNGEMIHIANKDVDHLVSPNHECWTKFGTSKWKKTKAKDIRKTVQLRQGGNWIGEPTPSTVVLGKQKLDPKAYLEFIGHWLADGFVSFHGDTNTYKVGFHLETELVKEWLTDRCPFSGNWLITHKKPVLTTNPPTCWATANKELAEELLLTCGQGDAKRVPAWVKQLDKEHLGILLLALTQKSKVVLTGSYQLAQDVAEIALKCGLGAKIELDHQFTYIVELSIKSKFSVQPKSVHKGQYAGIIWCVDVPNHLFVSERHGSFIVTGNSFSNTKTMALHRLMMEYKTKRDMFEDWMIHKFFRPIAEKNGFYVTENGKRKLILPQISWYKSLDIEEEQAEKEQYLKLHDKGFISTRTLFSKFPNLDFTTEQKHLEEEKGTVWDKEKGKRLPESIPESDLGAPSLGGGGPEPIEPLVPSAPGEPTEVAPENSAEGPEAATPEAPVVPETGPTPEV